MRRTLRVAVLSVWAAGVMVAAQAAVDATSSQYVASQGYESCPAKLSQVHGAASSTWSASFKCKAAVNVALGGVTSAGTGTVSASYSQWTTSTSDPCPNNFTFTPTITFDYSDRNGTIHFAAPMEVLGSEGGSPSQAWCYSEYNSSYQYPNNIKVTGTGAYAALDELCAFELGARTDVRGGTLLFSVDDQYGLPGQCYPSA